VLGHQNEGAELNSETMDHVDGHTLSSVPLTNVGCPDPSLLTNIFQDSVTESFIDFPESGAPQTFLTPVSSVFNAFSTSSPNFSSPSPQFTGTSCSVNYPLMRTPLYSSTDTFSQHHHYSGPPQHPLYPDAYVTDIGVQELDCINLQQIKSSDLDIPFTIQSQDDARLDMLARTWTVELKSYLHCGAWKDLTFRCRTKDGFQSISCHRLMVGASSPLIGSWLADMEGKEEDACIICPDFTPEEVAEFLDVVYLNSNKKTASFTHILRCIAGNDAVEKLKKEDRVLKGEDRIEDKLPKGEEVTFKGEDRKRSKVEIKLEELEMEKGKQQQQHQKQQQSINDDNKTSLMVSATLATDLQPVSVSTRAVKSKGPFTCTVCGKEFKVRRILKEHENLHSEPRFECSEELKGTVCGKRFHTRSNLRAHVDVVHLKKKNISCEICGKRFYNASLLKTHKETHSTEKLSCPHCPSTFAGSKSLRTHIRTQHTSEENVPTCNICQKTFSDEQSLKQHIARVHYHEKNHECHLCGKGFFERNELKVHLVTHAAGGSKLTCGTCLTTFKNKKNLLNHIRNKHEGSLQRKHVCHQCGKAFFFSYHLNRHMDGHKSKTCFCQICKKGFGSEAKVKDHHNKVHANKGRRSAKKTESCNTCGKKFNGTTGEAEDHARICHKLSPAAAVELLISDIPL